MGKHQLVTVQGYSLFEVASSLQKSIRRGYEKEAMYWSVELFNSNFDEFLWKRLKIISSEDVGLAEPMIAANIHALYQSFLDQKKKKDEKNAPERLFLTHAVFMLCRAKKSRVIDHALIFHWNDHYCERKPVPPYAYDKHTLEGKRAGFGWNHFFDEATRLENMGIVDGEDEYKELAKESVKNPCDPPEKIKPPTLF